jgi:D-glycero-D-manno-heptose 1,7-bisphosphate phosphatase
VLTQAAILAGPEAAASVGGKPFAWWLMRELQRFGVDRFLVLTEDAGCGHRLRESAAALPRPAALAFPDSLDEAATDERLLLLDGARLLDGGLGPLIRDAGADPPDAPCRTLLRESGAPAGAWAIGRSLLPRLGRDVPLPDGGARSTLAHGWFVDVRIPDDLARAKSEMAARLHRPALFLDRDGVLNVDHGYVASRERWEWVAGAREAVAAATARGWHVFVVTNQSGVARGYYSEEQMHALHAWVSEQVAQAGGAIDDWRHCPFHPDGSVPRFSRTSDWRKPAPGMILDLIRAWQPDVGRSLLVGDQPSDLQAAAAAGVATALFEGGRLDDCIAAALGRASGTSLLP